MKYKTYKQICEEKWKELEQIMGRKSKRGDGGYRWFYNWDFKKKDLEISVQIEYDTREFYTGITYGIRAKYEYYAGLNKRLKFTGAEGLEDFYYKYYWRLREILPKSAMRRVFLCGEPHESRDRKENENQGNQGKKEYYWPLWIRLEEKYPAIEVLWGTIVLLKALIAQGWTISKIFEESEMAVK